MCAGNKLDGITNNASVFVVILIYLPSEFFFSVAPIIIILVHAYPFMYMYNTYNDGATIYNSTY
jgi:hypothetical protein